MLYLLYEHFAGAIADLWIGSVLQVLNQLIFRALAGAVLAFFIVLFAGPRVIDSLRKRKIGDSGLTDAEALRSHTRSKARTPTMGGLLIVAAIAIATIMLADVTNFNVRLGLIVLLWLAVLGGVDDWLKLTSASRPGASRQGLRAWEKLVFQLGIGLLAGIFLYSSGDNPQIANDMAHVLTLPFQKTYEPAAAFAPNDALIFLPRIGFVIVTVLMIAGMSNAVNITDGMDGLATGISFAVAIGLVILTYIAGSQADAHRLLVPHIVGSDELIVMGAAMAGACLGFLWFNCAPAQVFMGDTGSLALGGLLAFIAVVIRQEILLLIMSSVFLLEIASVVMQVGYFRYTGGKRIFKCAPIHHHFHLKGWTEQQVVVRFWIVSIVLTLIALTLIKLR